MRWSLHKLTYYLIQLKQTDEILYCCGNNVVIYFVSEITTRLQSTDTDGAGSAFPPNSAVLSSGSSIKDKRAQFDWKPNEATQSKLKKQILCWARCFLQAQM